MLGTVNPRLTLFGNANSQHLAYGAWASRGLEVITNNQAGYMVLDIDDGGIRIYVRNKSFAKAFTQAKGYATWFSEARDGWCLGTLKAAMAA
jgi:hypothetical protein